MTARAPEGGAEGRPCARFDRHRCCPDRPGVDGHAHAWVGVPLAGQHANVAGLHGAGEHAGADGRRVAVGGERIGGDNEIDAVHARGHSVLGNLNGGVEVGG